MFWIKLTAALVFPTLVGFLLVSLLNARRDQSLAEKIFLGYGMGFGILSLGLFCQGAFGIPYSFQATLVLLGVTLAILLILSFLYRGSPENTVKNPAEKRDLYANILIILLIAWIAFRVALVLYEGFNRPIMSQDSWWNRSAKLFYYNQGLMLDDPADEHFFGKGYRVILGYPLLTFMHQIWISEFLGVFHESFMKAWAPLYLISVFGLIFTAIKKEAGLLAGLIAVFFVSAAPLLIYHSFEAYSDLALSYNVLAGSILLFRYMEQDDINLLPLSGIFFAMAGFTKSDGMIHLLSAGLALLAFNVIEKKYKWKGLVYFGLPALLYLLPWFIFKSHYGLGFGHGYGTGIGGADESGALMWSPTFHFEVWPVFFRELFLSVDHGLIFAFLALVSVLGFKTLLNTNIKYLFLIIVLAISGYLFVYTATFDFEFVLNRMATNRNLLSVTPLAFFVAGYITVKLLKKNSD